MVPANTRSLRESCSWECKVLGDAGLCGFEHRGKPSITLSQHGAQMANRRLPAGMCRSNHTAAPAPAVGPKASTSAASGSTRGARKAGPMLQRSLRWGTAVGPYFGWDLEVSGGVHVWIPLLPSPLSPSPVCANSFRATCKQASLQD